MADKAFLYDTTLCTACRGCQVACKHWNEHHAEKTRNLGSYENPKNLSPDTWVKIRFIEDDSSGQFKWHFLRQACMHCENASCATVCPVGAITKSPEGFVHIDQEWCIGCGTCTQACPFHIPHMDHEGGTVTKCHACTGDGFNRQGAGLEPACIKTCPTKAIRLDDRAALVQAGKERVAALKAAGSPNANLYGENILDGLHVMYVLDDKPSVYGLPENPQVATADMGAKWLSGLAAAGVVAGAPLLWIIKRREQMMSKGGAK